MLPSSDSSPELSFCVSTLKACITVTLIHDAASSLLIETKDEQVFSLDTKFLTFSRQPGEKDDLSTFGGSDGRAEVDGLGAVKLALGGAVPVVQVQGSSQMLLVFSGMMLKLSALSFQDGVMFPL